MKTRTSIVQVCDCDAAVEVEPEVCTRLNSLIFAQSESCHFPDDGERMAVIAFSSTCEKRSIWRVLTLCLHPAVGLTGMFFSGCSALSQSMFQR